MMWILNVAHTPWLHHINLLDKMPFETGVINIKLVKASMAMEYNAEYSTNGNRIDRGSESFVKINTRLLVKSFSNKPSFIPSNRALMILFDAKNHLLPTMFYPKLGGMRTKSRSE